MEKELEKLKVLLDEELITKKEYDTKKKEIEKKYEEEEKKTEEEVKKEETKEETKKEVVEEKPQEEKKETAKEEVKEEKVELKEEVKPEVKPAAEVKKVSKESNTNKQSKAPMIIAIVVVCAILLVGGGFLVANILGGNNKPIAEVWGETYYVYLKDIVANNKQEDAGLPEDIKNGKLGFYDVKELDDPVMVISYEEDDETYSNVYYIEDGKVNAKVYEDPTEVEFLYNIENDEYDYYTHTSDSESDTYQKVSDGIENNNDDNYTFTEEDKTVVTDNDGNEVEVSKYEETFAEVEVKDNTVDYNYELNEKELKNNINDSISDYKEQDDLVNKNVEKQVDDHIKEIEDRKEEMKEIEENSFKHGLTNMDDALKYEISYYGGGLLTSLFENGATTITAQDLPDSELAENIYQYMYNERDDVYDLDKVYTEDEIKEMLKDLYGKNYTYDHKFTELGACSSLGWDSSKNGYVQQGGCGGLSFESDPYYHSKILEKTDNTITIATMYVVPTADKKDMTIAKAPYKIYTDGTKKKEITSLNTKPSDGELDDIVEKSGIKYKVTFDIDNGFYHFKEVSIVN